jgi:hypothetical protein
MIFSGDIRAALGGRVVRNFKAAAIMFQKLQTDLPSITFHADAEAFPPLGGNVESFLSSEQYFCACWLAACCLHGVSGFYWAGILA